MNERKMIQVGQALRLGGSGVAARLFNPRDNVRITLTHYVHDDEMTSFGTIVDTLTKMREPIDPSDFVRAYVDRQTGIEGSRLLITFDDGLASSFTAAQQVLNPRGIKAIFFIPTMIFELDDAEQMRRFVWSNVHHENVPIETLRPERFITMTKEQVRTLHEQGHLVLPHTYSHKNLSEISTSEDAERELTRSRAAIEEIIQQPARGFAFPVGTERVVNPFSYEWVQTAYDYCFTALGGMNTRTTDKFFFRRDCIHPHFPLKHVRNIVAGVYDPIYGLKMKRLRRISTARTPAST